MRMMKGLGRARTSWGKVAREWLGNSHLVTSLAKCRNKMCPNKMMHPRLAKSVAVKLVGADTPHGGFRFDWINEPGR